MEQYLTHYGGIIGGMVLIILILVREKANKKSRCEFDAQWQKRVEKSVDTSYCEQRHNFMVTAELARDKRTQENFDKLYDKLKVIEKHMNNK